MALEGAAIGCDGLCTARMSPECQRSLPLVSSRYVNPTFPTPTRTAGAERTLAGCLAPVNLRCYIGTMNRAQFGAALGIATLAPTIFSYAGPNIIAAREAASDPEKRKALRQSNLIGGITVVGLGIAVGLILDDGDWLTVWAAVLAAGGMIALQEHALRHPKSDDAPTVAVVELQRDHLGLAGL